MRSVVISDTSCLIVLTNIGALDLLRSVYGKITTTGEIAAEYGEPLPDWIVVTDISNKAAQELLELQLDKGESSAIALALELTNATLILDDNKARTIARRLGLTITGTLGVIIKAKRTGHIASIKPLLVKLKQTDFRLTPALEAQALHEAEE